MSAPKGEYVFIFKAKKRSRPNPKYEGILRTHRFYIRYFTLIEGQDPRTVITKGEPKISFPVKYMEVVLDFAKELGGNIVGTRKIEIPKYKVSYETPIVVLPDEILFRRHLLFSLVISTYRKVSDAKFNSVRLLALTMNGNLLNILTTMALDRYFELRNAENNMRHVWHWYMMRVGRAVKVLYNLD